MHLAEESQQTRYCKRTLRWVLTACVSVPLPADSLEIYIPWKSIVVEGLSTNLLLLQNQETMISYALSAGTWQIEKYIIVFSFCISLEDGAQ